MSSASGAVLRAKGQKAAVVKPPMVALILPSPSSFPMLLLNNCFLVAVMPSTTDAYSWLSSGHNVANVHLAIEPKR